MHPLTPPPAIRTLAEACRDAGGRAWLVGGGVRDHLMGAAVKDWDIEVYGLAEDDLERVLGGLGSVNAVGRSFGVFKLRPKGWGPDDGELDVSIPRRDSKVGPGHRGISVAGDPSMTVHEAARRRDLTINAILVDPLTGEVEDPFGGREDIARGVLRAVDEATFLEDPLRALRVVQFAARLGFPPTAELVELCRRAPLAELAAERVQGEWGKLLLRGTNLSLGLEVARRTRVLSRVFPEAAEADATDLGPFLDRLTTPRGALEPAGRRWALMLVGWLWHAGASTVEATLDRLWLHRLQGYDLRSATLAAHAARHAPISTDADLRHLSARAETELVLQLRLAHGDGDASNALTRTAALGIRFAKPEPLLRGRDLSDLGFTPGPTMGRVLAWVYTRQLDGTVHTEEDARAAALEWRERLGH